MIVGKGHGIVFSLWTKIINKINVIDRVAAVGCSNTASTIQRIRNNWRRIIYVGIFEKEEFKHG